MTHRPILMLALSALLLSGCYVVGTAAAPSYYGYDYGYVVRPPAYRYGPPPMPYGFYHPHHYRPYVYGRPYGYHHHHHNPHW